MLHNKGIHIETYRNNTPRSGSGSGRKRERKLSTASSTTSCNSSSNKRHKKSGKTSSVSSSSAVSVTDRDNIPSQNSSSEPKFEASKLVERAEPEMVKPEATHLLNLPGSSGSSGLGSARNLMPPPDKKVENDSVLPENSATGAAALLPQNNHYMADQDELQVRDCPRFFDQVGHQTTKDQLISKCPYEKSVSSFSGILLWNFL